MKNIIDDLSWNCTENVQIETINRILSDKEFDYSILLQPINRKDCWENCAIILANLDDKLLIKYIHELLEWIQDLSWPGALIILERLKRFPNDMIKESLCFEKKIAIETNDIEWQNNLSEI